MARRRSGRGREGVARAAPRRRCAARRDARIEVRKTYKLYIGGAFPRTEIGRSYVVRGADGTPLANAVSRLAQGRARRGPRGAQGVPGLGGEDGHEPRPGPLPRGRADGGPARPVRGRGRRGRGPRRRPRAREQRRPGHRPLGLVRGLGGQDRPGPRLVEPGRGAVLQLHASPSRPASSASSRPETSSLLGLVSRLAPPLVSGNAVVVLASETPAAAGRDADRGARHVRRARAASSTS